MVTPAEVVEVDSLTLAVIIDIAAHEEGGGRAMQYASPSWRFEQVKVRFRF
jgi:hypothetical protein